MLSFSGSLRVFVALRLRMRLWRSFSRWVRKARTLGAQRACRGRWDGRFDASVAGTARTVERCRGRPHTFRHTTAMQRGFQDSNPAEYHSEKVRSPTGDNYSASSPQAAKKPGLALSFYLAMGIPGTSCSSCSQLANLGAGHSAKRLGEDE
jgi:hypothetical protein